MSQNSHNINQVGVCFHYFINRFIKDFKKMLFASIPITYCSSYEKASEYDQEMSQSQTNSWHLEEEAQNISSHTTARSQSKPRMNC